MCWYGESRYEELIICAVNQLLASDLDVSQGKLAYHWNFSSPSLLKHKFGVYISHETITQNAIKNIDFT